MKFLAIALLLYLFNGSVTLLGAESVVERDDWEVLFSEVKLIGTIAVVDGRNKKNEFLVCDIDRSKIRFSPASTFKIPHALFALDAGVVKDEFQVFKWDGVKRFNSHWNKDQNLRTSMQKSVVWVYEEFAKEIGEGDEQAYLKEIDYGNAKPTGEMPFWIKGDLRISAMEQLDFLQKLYQNDLPFKEEHQRLVKDIMVVKTDDEYVLRGKSGWTGKLAWTVGWLETGSGPIFFAINYDTPNKMKDLKLKGGILEAVFASLNVKTD